MDGMTRVRPAPVPRQQRISDGEPPRPGRGQLYADGHTFDAVRVPGSHWIWLFDNRRAVGWVSPDAAGAELFVLPHYCPLITPRLRAVIINAARDWRPAVTL